MMTYANLLKVKVVGIFRTRTQSDSELIAPIEAIYPLTGNDGKTSLSDVLT